MAYNDLIKTVALHKVETAKNFKNVWIMLFVQQVFIFLLYVLYLLK